MSKKVRITLLPLAAFLFLGFSIAANAGNPWLADKEQVMISAPLTGSNHICSVIWLGDQTTNSVRVELFKDDGSTPLAFLPGELKFGDTSAISQNDLGVAYCTVQWTGQPSDLKATWCVVEEYAGFSGCIELH